MCCHMLFVIVEISGWSLWLYEVGFGFTCCWRWWCWCCCRYRYCCCMHINATIIKGKQKRGSPYLYSQLLHIFESHFVTSATKTLFLLNWSLVHILNLTLFMFPFQGLCQVLFLLFLCIFEVLVLFQKLSLYICVGISAETFIAKYLS